MAPVGFDIGHVVQEVGATRRRAEGDERDERPHELVGLVEHARRRGGDEHEHVLQPLLGPGLDDQRQRQGSGDGGHWRDLGHDPSSVEPATPGAR
jgi:hypothetical protein